MEAFVQLTPDVYRLSVPFPGCWTGVTLVMGEENVLVDSGGCGETVDSCLVPALARLGLTLGDIAWVSLTHIHGDHVGGCGRIRELAPEVKFAAFRASADRLRDPLAYSKAIRARFPEHSAPAPARLCGVEAEVLMDDGDRLGNLQLVYTPGHDTDSCSFLDVRTRTLITGDSLQLNGTVSQGCALLMDVQGYHETLNRLMGMELDYIVCGHPYLPLGAEAIGPRAVREFLTACRLCDAHDGGFVAGMVAGGCSDPQAIARALIREVGGREPAHLFLPLYTVTEYINKRRQCP